MGTAGGAPLKEGSPTILLISLNFSTSIVSPPAVSGNLFLYPAPLCIWGRVYADTGLHIATFILLQDFIVGHSSSTPMTQSNMSGLEDPELRRSLRSRDIDQPDGTTVESMEGVETSNGTKLGQPAEVDELAGPGGAQEGSEATQVR